MFICLRWVYWKISELFSLWYWEGGCMPYPFPLLGPVVSIFYLVRLSVVVIVSCHTVIPRFPVCFLSCVSSISELNVSGICSSGDWSIVHLSTFCFVPMLWAHCVTFFPNLLISSTVFVWMFYVIVKHCNGTVHVQTLCLFLFMCLGFFVFCSNLIHWCNCTEN